jgi:UDP-GlcNAc:undecaprenyl-phosphate GlcNAc-1-phosphate transferase
LPVALLLRVLAAQAVLALAVVLVQETEHLAAVALEVMLALVGLGPLAVPFTVFAAVGFVNALNMIDGSDGLAGGLVLVSLLLLAAFALYSGDPRIFGRLMTVAAAVSGFLVWNMRFPWQPRARVFLGNAGFAGPDSVEVGGQRLRFAKAAIAKATGEQA